MVGYQCLIRDERALTHHLWRSSQNKSSWKQCLTLPTHHQSHSNRALGILPSGHTWSPPPILWTRADRVVPSPPYLWFRNSLIETCGLCPLPLQLSYSVAKVTGFTLGPDFPPSLGYFPTEPGSPSSLAFPSSPHHHHQPPFPTSKLPF